VFREDSGGQTAPTSTSGTTTRSFGVTFGPGGTGGSLKRGAGFAVDLPAYENDVLHALALTGGLPGLDAVNEVVIQRGYFQDELDTEFVSPDTLPKVIIHEVYALPSEAPVSAPRADNAASEALARELQGLPSDGNPRKAVPAWKADGRGQAAQISRGGQTVRIPLRLRPGQVPSVRPEDIVLHTGDILYIESREAEYFYTGGLLPPGQFTVPRDYDLDVVQAIALVGGPLVSGGVNPINLTGTSLSSGIGFPSPSLVSVLRRTPDGRQVVIHVDLNQALRDPRERVLIQPRDLILLQEKPSEALARYFTNVFRFNFSWLPIHGPHETGTTSVTVP